MYLLLRAKNWPQFLKGEGILVAAGEKTSTLDAPTSVMLLGFLTLHESKNS